VEVESAPVPTPHNEISTKTARQFGLGMAESPDGARKGGRI
jgi:hypothetical protein